MKSIFLAIARIMPISWHENCKCNFNANKNGVKNRDFQKTEFFKAEFLNFMGIFFDIPYPNLLRFPNPFNIFPWKTCLFTGDFYPSLLHTARINDAVKFPNQLFFDAAMFPNLSVSPCSNWK